MSTEFPSTDTEADKSWGVHDDAETQDGSRKSAIQRLMAAADEHLVVIRSHEGKALVARRTIPHLVEPVSDRGCEPVSAILNQYTATHGKPPPRDAVRSLIDLLSWQADVSPRVPVHIRSAWSDGVIWIDTGWTDGSVIRVSADGWDVQDSCPIFFTRSRQAGQMADPRGASPDLKALGRFVNCNPEDLPLIVAVLVTTFFDGVPQPVLSVFGGADSGKTTATRFLLDLIDPSVTQAGSPLPKDDRTIKAMAAQRRVLLFDNVSYLDADQSDIVARVATGGEIVTRALYTDDSAHVTQLMRPVIINGIMDGFSRSDLASRAVSMHLAPVAAADRVGWEELQSRWVAERGGILSGLLDLLVEVLVLRDCASGPWDSRMVEFQRNLRTIDSILGTSGEQRLAEQAQDLATSVLDASAVGMGLRAAVECARASATTYCAQDCAANLFNHQHRTPDTRRFLVQHLSEEEARHLPRTDRSLGEAITRIAADLEAVLHVRVERTRTKGARYVTFKDLDAS